MSIQLRPVTLADAALVYQWRNDPFIVSVGTTQRAVAWEEHLNWFRQTVAGKSRKMFIIEINSIAAGQVRFDRRDDADCVISVYLLEQFTGKGWGVSAIRQACDITRREWPNIRVIACVRRSNEPARRAFLKSGFTECMDADLCPAEHSCFVQLADEQLLG